MAKKVGVYLIRCTATNRVYVGSSSDIAKRWTWHRHALSKRKHHISPLQERYDAAGLEGLSFEVAELCEREQLMSREQAHIEAHGVYVANSSPTAVPGRGRKSTPEQRERARQAAIKRGACPEERARRAERARAQHAAGKLGAATWVSGPDKSKLIAAGFRQAERLRAHIAEQSSEEMSRRGRSRKSKEIA